MYKSYLVLLSIGLFGCQEKEIKNQDEVRENEPTTRDYMGEAMEVPDSIIKKYQNMKEDIFIHEKNDYKFPAFYKNCCNIGYIFSDYLYPANYRGGYSYLHLNCSCICMEIENGALFRSSEKIQYLTVIPSQDSFSLISSILTPSGKFFVQKRTYCAEEPPLPSVEVLINRKKEKRNSIHLGDSVFIYVKPEGEFKNSYHWADNKYFLEEASMYVKNKHENQEKRYGEVVKFDRKIRGEDGTYIPFPKRLVVPVPKELWEMKDLEYIILKVNGLYRYHFSSSIKKDSLLPIYDYDSIFRFNLVK